MDNEIKHSNASTIMFSFLLGGLVGAGLALLLAPESGAETRRRISELSGDLRKRADDALSQARESVGSAIEKGKDAYHEKKSAVASAIDAGRDAYRKEKEKGAAEG